MASVRDQIEAEQVVVDGDVTIGRNSIIRGKEVRLGKGVRIGNDVEITCDTLELRSGCRIGSGSDILCPNIVCEEGCALGNLLQVELNEYLHLGRHGNLGHRVTVTGQGFKSGEFLWLKDDVIVGGGGAKGPRSYLTIGNRSSVFDKCFINVSEDVSIGSNSALSYNVVLLTHGAWQPSLMGYPTRFAPIRIGSHVVIYLNSVVLPGVTVGDYSTVGAGSVVRDDIPNHCLAAGNPARIRRGPTDYPHSPDSSQLDSLIRAVLADYISTLESKGVRVVHDFLPTEGYFVVEFEGRQETICHIPIDTDLHLNGKADITLSYGPVRQELLGKCHFDLAREMVTGDLTRIAEDLRDFLRRQAIRIFTGEPFQSLPLANLHRLQMRRQGGRQ